MPRKRLARRGRVGTPSAGTPAEGALVLSTAVLGLNLSAGDTVTFSEAPITLTNAGPGSWAGPTLSIAYGSGAGWLSFTPRTASDGTITLTPVVNASALTAATYLATVTVHDANCANSGLTIAVSAVVAAASPTLSLFPSALALSIVDETATGTASTTTLSNIGSGTIATPSAGVITGAGAAYIKSVGFTANGDGTWAVSVVPTATGGTAGGPYRASIPIVSAGASNTPLALDVDVTVTSTALAVLALDRNLDDVAATVGAGNPPSQSVGVRNVGGGTLAGPTVQSTTYSGSFTGWAAPSIAAGTLTVAVNTASISTEGTSTVSVVIADANAAATVTYQVYLRTTAAVKQPLVIVSPASVGVQVQAGSNAPATTIALTNANGPIADLGTLSVAFSPGVAWCAPSYTTGQITLTFATTGLPAGSVSGSLVVTAPNATNSPVTIPVGVTVGAVSVGTYPPAPQVAALPQGWSYDRAVGYFKGSCFNAGGYAGAANGAMPTFAGTEHIVTNGSQLNAALAACVDGDIITITKGGTYDNVQVPKRAGWTEGTSGFVWVRTSGHASLPGYQSTRSPTTMTSANRAKDAHLPNMVTFRATDQWGSPLCLQQGTGGWWFTGIRFLRDYANAAYIPGTVLTLDGHSGTNAAQWQLAHVPSHLVFDRCLVRANRNPYRAVKCDARYVVWQQSSLCDTYNNDTEPQAFLFINGGARADILGCSFSGWGEHILVGGGDPAITDFVPTDVMVQWNYAWNDIRAYGGISNDNKNAFEHKTGGRFCYAFNKVKGIGWKGDQQYAFLTKATDQGSGSVQTILYPAHTYDILFWGNDLSEDVAKGFFVLSDRFSEPPSSAPLGCERIELAWNVHYFDTTVPHLDGYVTSDRKGVSLYRASGDGSPQIWIYHNTFSARQSMWNGDVNNNGGGWASVRVFNNALNEQTLYGPFFGSSEGDNSTGLNKNYGAGNWDCSRNFLLPGGADWDATLKGGSYQNGRFASSDPNVVFVSPATRDFTLKVTAGYDGLAYGGGFQTTIGYSRAYMAEMLAGVTAD